MLFSHCLSTLWFGRPFSTVKLAFNSLLGICLGYSSQVNFVFEYGHFDIKGFKLKNYSCDNPETHFFGLMLKNVLKPIIKTLTGAISTIDFIDISRDLETASCMLGGEVWNSSTEEITKIHCLQDF